MIAILSLTGLSISSIPVRFISSLIGALNKHFIHMADTIFIHEAPTFIMFSWTIIKTCFNKETNDRIKFTTLKKNIILE
jgi:hypothetical protein